MKRASLYICLAILFASCAKEGPTGPTGPVGPSLSGSLSGHLKLYDMYGSSIDTGYTHASLYLNTSTTPLSPDVSGYYQFTTIGGVAITTGMYSVAATDSAFAHTVKNNIQIVTGNLNVDIKMSALPDSILYNFSANHVTGSVNDSLAFTFKSDTRQRNCIVFANSSPVVNSQPANYMWSKVIAVSPTAPFVSFLLPGQDLINAGFKSGSKVYFAAYSYVIGDVSVYEDFTTGKNVYNAVSGVHVDSTIVP